MTVSTTTGSTRTGFDGTGRRGVLPHVWSVVLPVLMLGPALLPGYVLSYDMVFVPHLAMRSDFLGAGVGLPRAVPSDAVVALLDNVVPGMLLQKLVLLGALVLLGQGAIRLVGSSLTARLTAVSVAVWNPFVVERLWIGHWPVLLGYAAVPWLVVLVRRAREERRLPLALWFVVPLGCLSASAGLVTALVVLVIGVGRGAPIRRHARLVALVLAGNAPWVVAGLLHASTATTQVGARVFALHAEGSMPAPLAALGMGGIWNSEVVPASRTGGMAWVSVLGLLFLAGCGAHVWWQRSGRSDSLRQIACWVVGYGIAALTWLAPVVIGWLGESVPGGGIIRDGTRTLGLCLPLVVGLTATGAEELVRRMGSRSSGIALLVACTLFPVMVMTDAAWGMSGALRPAHYPRSWSQARASLQIADDRLGGDVLVLPFSSYRAPRWNGGRKVLDPLGRFLTPDYVTNDELTVSGTEVPGDDPRVPRIRNALDQPEPSRRSVALTRIGVRFVVLDLEANAREGSANVFPAGRTLYESPQIRVLQLDGAVGPRRHSPAWWSALIAAWVAFLGTLFMGVLKLAHRSLAMRRR